ncbi:uncharacterized protein LOC130725493 [Lotus japonicus]|uniref:uncharacterized protein LOC130725493 n=1 Tax=Lotus japonicus TaxID=34305 RepID=UPI00258EF0B4|nr:uncharacterized protein LOC130725493 [Lotus japonicus]
MSWNIRGAAAKGVPLLLKDVVLRHQIFCVALFEPKVKSTKLPIIMKTLNFDGSFVVEAEGFSGGIWVMWSKHWGAIQVLSSHRQLVHLRVNPTNGSPSFLVSFTYGSPNLSIRNFLWQELRRIAANTGEPWVVMGDFNTYLNAPDKWGGDPPNLLAMGKFRDCLDDCYLSDLGFKGPPFTWEGRGVKERLEWALGNDQWLRSFPEASIFHLPQLKSDHKPLLLQLSPTDIDHSQRPFRFVAAWLTHSDFPRLVKHSWQTHNTWIPAYEAFRADAMT